jgi:guanyl-specific ribonuclease Sa
MGLNVYVSEVYEQLNGMTAALNRTIDKLSDYLSSVEDFVNDTVLKGVSYDSMKTYFGEVHAPWAKGMIAACEAMIEANNAYINTFVEMVDASGTDIIEEDIRYMMMKLSHSINNFQAINQAAGEEVVDTWHLEQLEAEHQRLLERLYDFDSSTADYYNYAQSLIEAAKQGGSLMGNSWDASTSTFLNPAMLNMEWRPLVDSAWEKLSEEYILFRGKYVHARRKLEQYWNRQDGYFEGFWWQDIEKMKEAYRMLDLEIAQKGGIKIHDLITSEYMEDQLKMYALQSLSNAPRTGTYDLEFLHSLENMYLKADLDYSETDHTIDKKGLEALKECYKNIKLKKSGDWLERGGGDIIAGVTLIAGGMVMSRAGNRSLKIRSEGMGNTGSGKTYSVKRGPQLQGKGAGRAGKNVPKVKPKEILKPKDISEPKGNGSIPDHARDIVNQIKNRNGAPPQGYKGGRTFKNEPVNGEQKLPGGINYKEYDVNPYVQGQNRGTERLVIGDDGSVWYTNDHYHTFTLLE